MGKLSSRLPPGASRGVCIATNVKPTHSSVQKDNYGISAPRFLFGTSTYTMAAALLQPGRKETAGTWRLLGRVFTAPSNTIPGIPPGFVAVGDCVVVRRPTGVYTGAVVHAVNDRGYPTLLIDTAGTTKGPIEHPEQCCFAPGGMKVNSFFQTPERKPPKAVGPPPIQRHRRCTQIPGMRRSTSEIQGHGVDEPEAFAKAMRNSLRDFGPVLKQRRGDDRRPVQRTLAGSIRDTEPPRKRQRQFEVIDLTT